MRTKCHCGKTSKSHERTSSVGRRTELTGYRWLVCEGGGSNWICPECWEKLVEHYKAIYRLVGDKYLVHPFVRKEVVGD